MTGHGISDNDKRRVIDRLYRALSRIVANHGGAWRTCEKATCRRARACRGTSARANAGCGADEHAE